ncbi:MAG: nitrate ABC transporter ATP-binding protein [Candidatus Rokuibacteriota bacterium]|nr:MAG: nitrate ABC transporter ATP-binding protein [Candidatus Rokubacteria bacterium]
MSVRAPAAHPASDTPAGADRPHITIRGLSKRFGEHALYTDFDLDLPKAQITSVFGPNGCGKSTMINMVAGLVPKDAGTVLFDGKPIEQTVIGYVFQNYREALFPWKRALDNITYPLRLAGKSSAQCAARAEEVIQAFDIKFDLHRYPYELSGGQQQLISIMRALAPHPEVLFLDEPFSALDYEMTLFMRDKLQDAFRATRTTTVLVSHDLEEAVYLADQILLLTRPPTRIAEIVPFRAPRPRHPETLTSEDFVDVKARCLDVFQREVRKK